MKTFTLRNVQTFNITSVDALRSLIRDNFREDIKRDFDVGYIHGTNVVRVWSKDDFSDMWLEIKKTKNTSLWCDGLAEKKGGKKRKVSSDDDDEDSDEEQPPSKKLKKKSQDRDETVQDLVDSLKSKHGSKYNAMQMRIWAELIVSNVHSSLDDPPENNTMFERAGSGNKTPKSDGPIAKVVAEAATAIISALCSNAGQATVSTSSPVKVIESRSKLYKQLTELQNLKSAGVLDDSEYKVEKETIMKLLKKLTSV